MNSIEDVAARVVPFWQKRGMNCEGQGQRIKIRLSAGLDTFTAV